MVLHLQVLLSVAAVGEAAAAAVAAAPLGKRGANRGDSAAATSLEVA